MNRKKLIPLVAMLMLCSSVLTGAVIYYTLEINNTLIVTSLELRLLDGVTPVTSLSWGSYALNGNQTKMLTRTLENTKDATIDVYWETEGLPGGFTLIIQNTVGWLSGPSNAYTLAPYESLGINISLVEFGAVEGSFGFTLKFLVSDVDGAS